MLNQQLLHDMEKAFSELNSKPTVAYNMLRKYVQTYEELILKYEFAIDTHQNNENEKEKIQSLNYGLLYPLLEKKYFENFAYIEHKGDLSNLEESLINEDFDNEDFDENYKIEINDYDTRIAILKLLNRYGPDLLKKLTIQAEQGNKPANVLLGRFSYLFANNIIQELYPTYYFVSLPLLVNNLADFIKLRHPDKSIKNIANHFYILDSDNKLHYTDYINLGNLNNKIYIGKLSDEKVDCIYAFLEVSNKHKKNFFIRPLSQTNISLIRTLKEHTLNTNPRGEITNILKSIYEVSQKGWFSTETCALITLDQPPVGSVLLRNRAFEIMGDQKWAYALSGNTLYYVEKDQGIVSTLKTLTDQELELIKKNFENISDNSKIAQSRLDAKSLSYLGTLTKHTTFRWLFSATLNHFEKELTRTTILPNDPRYMRYLNHLFSTLPEGGDPSLFSLLLNNVDQLHHKTQTYPLLPAQQISIQNYIKKIIYGMIAEELSSVSKGNVEKYIKTYLAEMISNELFTLNVWSTTQEKSAWIQYINYEITETLEKVPFPTLKTDLNAQREFQDKHARLDSTYLKELNAAVVERQVASRKKLHNAYVERLLTFGSYDQKILGPYLHECDFILAKGDEDKILHSAIPGNATYAFIMTEDKIFYVEKGAYKSTKLMSWPNLEITEDKIPKIIEEFKKHFNVKNMPGEPTAEKDYQVPLANLICHTSKISMDSLIFIVRLLNPTTSSLNKNAGNDYKNTALMLNESLLVASSSEGKCSQTSTVEAFFLDQPIALKQNFQLPKPFTVEMGGLQFNAGDLVKDGNTLLHELAKYYQEYLDDFEFAKSHKNIIDTPSLASSVLHKIVKPEFRKRCQSIIDDPKNVSKYKKIIDNPEFSKDNSTNSLLNTSHFPTAVILRSAGLSWNMRNIQGQNVFQYSGLKSDSFFVKSVERDFEQGMSYLAYRALEFIKYYSKILEERYQNQDTRLYKVLKKLFNSFQPDHQRQRYQELIKIINSLIGSEKTYDHKKFFDSLRIIIEDKSNFPRGLLSRGEFLIQLEAIFHDVVYLQDDGSHPYYNNSTSTIEHICKEFLNIAPYPDPFVNLRPQGN